MTGMERERKQETKTEEWEVCRHWANTRSGPGTKAEEASTHKMVRLNKRVELYRFMTKVK